MALSENSILYNFIGFKLKNKQKKRSENKKVRTEKVNVQK